MDNHTPGQQIQQDLSGMVARKMRDDLVEVRNMITRAQQLPSDPSVDDMLRIVDRLASAVDRMKFLLFPERK